ncbi:MAG: GNAT family N-acetyltransferase [Candidatus Omnitrophica bacterium]|nr:GNAT family N-acetyltransferase [Candidatus Omnitrophota bacterium]
MKYEISKYLDITRNTEAFTEGELDTLKEVLEDLRHNNKTSYNLLEEEIDDKLVGFALFGRTPLTEFTWDIYWLIVDKSFQGRGIGKSLLIRTEEFIREKMPRAAIKLETSTRKKYSAARGLYKRVKFQEAGKLPNFYCEGDDMIIFYKEISAQNKNM